MTFLKDFKKHNPECLLIYSDMGEVQSRLLTSVAISVAKKEFPNVSIVILEKLPLTGEKHVICFDENYRPAHFPIKPFMLLDTLVKEDGDEPTSVCGKYSHYLGDFPWKTCSVTPENGVIRFWTYFLTQENGESPNPNSSFKRLYRSNYPMMRGQQDIDFRSGLEVMIDKFPLLEFVAISHFLEKSIIDVGANRRRFLTSIDKMVDIWDTAKEKAEKKEKTDAKR